MESESATGSRRYALILLVAGLATGAVGLYYLPGLLVVVLVGVLLWGAGTLWFRTVDWQELRGFRTVPDEVEHGFELAPGESYDTAVLLTSTPNVPLAEAICSHLQANGIDAFWKRGVLFQATSMANDFVPAEVWVGGQDLERAQSILDESEGGSVEPCPN